MCKVNTPVISENFSKTVAQKKFREIQKSRNIKNENSKLANNEQYHSDALAVFTKYTKLVLFEFSSFLKDFEKSKTYKIIFGTTQPAHLFTIVAVATVAFMLSPQGEIKVEKPPSPILTMVYLASFSIHFGAQIWMTFVSGLALYFSLPRHSFGEVQKILFPKYFVLNAAMSLISLCVFLKHNKTQLHVPQVGSQAGTMTLCFLIEVFIRQYLSPPLLKLMALKNDMEKAAGVGKEVGKHDAGELVNCPHYLKIYKGFRKIHMTIAIGNIICMSCCVYHLHYLSHKLCAI